MEPTFFSDPPPEYSVFEVDLGDEVMWVFQVAGVEPPVGYRGQRSLERAKVLRFAWEHYRAHFKPADGWHALPCSPTDIGSLIKLMPGGWVEIEWSAEASSFTVLNAWGVTPAVFDDYEWQNLHPDPGPGMHHNRPDDCFEHWPDGRRCLAEHVYVKSGEEGDAGFRLLAVHDDLVYADPEGTREPATFEMCQDCDANLGSEHRPDDHCPVCHKDGTLLLMREDGVRVP